MGRRDDLIATYAEDLREKCGIEPDMALLDRVTAACGPLIYDPVAATVDPTDRADLERIGRNFLMRKLGLDEGPDLIEAIETVLEMYGPSEPAKKRVVVYYMLVKHFGRDRDFP
ncbi:DUF2853 family protein [Palleronia sp. KMU-117]|uniref:DUF2853 family protein n=1 Tax=Palleronia sp. KMU-117 TaxID=3434108 RepID=UPI003D73BB62